MSHPISHVEIPSTDPGKSKEFYSKLFGWKVDYNPEYKYSLFDTGKAPGGGFFVPPEGTPPANTFYITVESVEECSHKARELGGKVLVEKTSIGEGGWFAMIQDTCGSVIGIWEEAKKGGQ